jgi:xylan 1,4-beta-xylosidase
VRRTGYKANDAYSAYLEMGAPKALDPAQLKRLQDLTQDLPEKDRTVQVGRDGRLSLDLPMHANDIVLVQLAKAG